MLKKQETKLQPQFRLAEEFLDLKTMNTGIIVEQLEQNIKARELTLEQQLKKKLMR